MIVRAVSKNEDSCKTEKTSFLKCTLIALLPFACSRHGRHRVITISVSYVGCYGYTAAVM